MAITIRLPLETERKAQERAAQTGQTVDRYIEQLVEKDVANGGRPAGGDGSAPQRGKSFADILAPVHEEFRQSGITEEELGALIEDCRKEVWDEKKDVGKSP